MKEKTTGDILLKLEKNLDALCDQGLQWSDILALVYIHLMVHRPDSQEEYTDGTHPVFYYGPEKGQDA